MLSLRRQSGFSLMELAIVLMIIGTLMGGVLVAIGDSFESGRRSAALNQLRQIEEAIYGFAAHRGRLPCPAGVDGLELCPPTPDTPPISFGFLPIALGLSGRTDVNGILLDPWGNPYLYAAHDAYIIDAPETIALQFSSTGTLGPLLTVATDAACGGTVINSTVTAIIISRGASGTTPASAIELENYDSDDACFVSSSYAEDVFDDQLQWISPYILFNRMISAGRLP